MTMKLIRKDGLEGDWWIEKYYCPKCNKLLFEYLNKDGTTLEQFFTYECPHYQTIEIDLDDPMREQLEKKAVLWWPTKWDTIFIIAPKS